MMNLLNMIPIVGWVVAAIMCFLVAIPVFFLWGWLAPVYFYWLPAIYHSIPFWHMFGLIWLITSVKGILLPSFSSTNTQTNN